MPASGDLGLLPRRLAAVAASVSGMLVAASAAASPIACEWLGFLPDGYAHPMSKAQGISGDGSVVVGYGLDAAGNYRAFRWTRPTGMQPIAANPDGSGPETVALRVSADGAVVIGWTRIDGQRQVGFRWTAATGIEPLGFLPGRPTVSPSYAQALNSDGSIIVGSNFGGFRWTRATGLRSLPSLNGNDQASDARGISVDGSTIVGLSASLQKRDEPVLWRETGGIQALGYIDGGGPAAAKGGMADATNRDGSVIVGYSSNAKGEHEAFRWTADGGMHGLGFLSTAHRPESNAYAVSADGTTVVGDSLDSGGSFEPVVWTAGEGLRSLTPYLGGPPSEEEDLAADVSTDGSMVVGGATDTHKRTQAFLCRTK